MIYRSICTIINIFSWQAQPIFFSCNISKEKIFSTEYISQGIAVIALQHAYELAQKQNGTPKLRSQPNKFNNVTFQQMISTIHFNGLQRLLTLFPERNKLFNKCYLSSNI